MNPGVPQGMPTASRNMSTRLLLAAFAGAALVNLAGCDSGDLTGLDASEGTDALAATVNLGNFDADASDGTVDLIGGKNTKVGTVSWTDAGGGGVEVTYQTLAGYCITEWHLDGGNVNGPGTNKNQFSGIPLNNAGNPKNGNFAYSGGGACLTTVTQVIPAAQFTGAGDRIIAAHAKVISDPDGKCDYFYGIASDGNIYQISLGDLMTPGDETETLFYSTGLEVAAVAETWPNSLAYNGLTDRLYYSNAEAFGPPTGEGVPDPTSPLFFYNFATATGNTPAGDLSRRSASGTFIGGDLYYVPQNLTDNLRRVTFNADGTINTDALACPDFSDMAGETPMFFGDLAYDPANGLIYGSVRFQAMATGDPISTFFSVNPGTCAYTPINTETFLSQLTIDCDGNLIGFNTNTQEFYVVNRATGAQTVVGDSEYAINDLAPGKCECVGEFDETAWGAGPSFPGNNWSMFIRIGGGG